jgi:hypothetical protein
MAGKHNNTNNEGMAVYGRKWYQSCEKFLVVLNMVS